MTVRSLSGPFRLCGTICAGSVGTGQQYLIQKKQTRPEPDLTEKWILRNVKPAMIVIYAMALMAVINNGNMMEAKQNEKTNEPVDVIAEEERAKKQPET